MISYGIFVSTLGNDNNIIVSGKTTNITTTDHPSNVVNYDGFVMRLTPLGFINWMSYLSFK